MSDKNQPSNQKEANSLYSEFIDALIQHNIQDVADVIYKILGNRESIEDKMRRVDQLKSWLDSFRPLSADVVAELKKQYDVKFTYNSNAIEGNTLTQSETELVLEKGITVGGKTLVEHLEAVGHKEAIDYIEYLAKKNSAIGEREVNDIHHLVMKGVEAGDAGQYRKLDVRASGTGHIYPPHYRVKELMSQFIEWLSSDEAKALHPVKLATESHYKFVSIHPYKDGNGRTARLLMNLIMLRHAYPVTVISNEKRSEYIESLVYAQSNQNNVEKLYELVLDCAEESLVDYLRVASTADGSANNGVDFYIKMNNFLK